MIRKSLTVIIGLLLASLTVSYAARLPHHHVIETQPYRVDDTAPLLSASNAEIIPNSYIVVLKENAELDSHLVWFNTLLTAQLVRGKEVNSLKHVYSIADGLMKGYSGVFDQEMVDQIRSSPEVSYPIPLYVLVYGGR